MTVAGAGSRPTTVIGVRAGLRPGRGRTSVPVRSVLITSGLAIAAVVAAFTFTSNLDHVANTPRLYGWDWIVQGRQRLLPRARTPGDEGRSAATRTSKRSPARTTATCGSADGRSPRWGSTRSRARSSRRCSRVERREQPRDRARHAHVAARRTAVGKTVQRASPSEKPLSMRIVGRAVFPKLGAGSFTPTNLGEGAATRASVFADLTEGAPGGKYWFLRPDSLRSNRRKRRR